MTSRAVATPDQAGALASLIAAAFEDDPVMSWVFAAPGTREKLDAFFAFFSHEVYVPLGASYLTADACAVWTPPEPPPWPPDRVDRFSAAMDGVCEPADLERLRLFGQASDGVHPAEPHWYLSVLAVWPDRRGHGFGGVLLADTLARVDAEGLPAYLESTNPRNVGLYERHGFVVTGEVPLPGGPSFTTMWRPARAT